MHWRVQSLALIHAVVRPVPVPAPAPASALAAASALLRHPEVLAIAVTRNGGPVCIRIRIRIWLSAAPACPACLLNRAYAHLD